MRSPFPGMDPYLEHPELGSEVHSRLIVAIADAIALPLRPRYYVAVEKRTYLSDPDESLWVGIPDVSVFSPTKPEQQIPSLQTTATTVRSPMNPLTVTVPLLEDVQERYLEVREIKTGAVITVIEVLSPKNKRTGAGRDAYLRKRQRVLNSQTHLVEIDLLRTGQPMPLQDSLPSTDYRVLVSRRDERPQAHLYAFTLREAIPAIPLPLQPGESEPWIELNDLLSGVYERSGFDLRIDYQQPSVPPLSATDQDWFAQRHGESE